MEWWITQCKDYKDIKINEANLAQYPSDTNIKLPSVDEAADENDKKSKTANAIPKPTNREKHPFENEDEDLNLPYKKYVESLRDIPEAIHTVNENIATDTIENYVKKSSWGVANWK